MLNEERGLFAHHYAALDRAIEVAEQQMKDFIADNPGGYGVQFFEEQRDSLKHIRVVLQAAGAGGGVSFNGNKFKPLRSPIAMCCYMADDYRPQVEVLLDDGSIFWRDANAGGSWESIQPVPGTRAAWAQT